MDVTQQELDACTPLINKMARAYNNVSKYMPEEDLRQELYLELYAKAPKYRRGAVPFEHWAACVLSRCAKRVYGKMHGAKFKPESGFVQTNFTHRAAQRGASADGGNLDIFEEILDKHDDLKPIDDADERELMYRGMNELCPELRLILDLRLRGLQWKQIMQLTGSPLKRVQERYDQAVAFLRVYLTNRGLR